MKSPMNSRGRADLSPAVQGSTTGELRTSASALKVQRTQPVSKSSAYTVPSWLPT